MILGVGEAARRLGVDVTTLVRWCDKGHPTLGEIKHQRDSANRRMFDSVDIDNLAEETKRKARQAGSPRREEN